MDNQKRMTDSTKTEEIRPNWQCQCQKSHQDDLLLHCNSTTRFRCWSCCGCSCCVPVSNLGHGGDQKERKLTKFTKLSWLECMLFANYELVSSRLNSRKMQFLLPAELQFFQHVWSPSWIFSLPRSISFAIYKIISWWGQWTKYASHTQDSLHKCSQTHELGCHAHLPHSHLSELHVETPCCHLNERFCKVCRNMSPFCSSSICKPSHFTGKAPN